MYFRSRMPGVAARLPGLLDIDRSPGGDGRRRGSRPSADGDGRAAGDGRLRCLIVDDSIRFIGAARRLLENDGLTVVGAATNGRQARTLMADLKPDVILVDFFLGRENGFEFIIENGGNGSHSIMVLCSTCLEEDVLAIIGGRRIPFLPKTDLSGSALRDIVHARRA